MKLTFITIAVYSLVSSVCGLYGSTPVEPGQFPYFASITLVNKNYTLIMCGGAIISNRDILTSAVCLKGYSKQFIKPTVGDGVSYEVDEIIFHPSFDAATTKNDLAIIKVENIEFNDLVQPIALGEADYNGGEDAFIVGHGALQEDDVPPSPQLQYINTKTVSVDACDRGWTGSGGAREEYVCTETTTFYLDPPGRGSCAGDRGNPVIVNNTLVGISHDYLLVCASGGRDRAQRVQEVADWIQAVIEK